MSTITKEQAKDLRNAFQCWQQDYEPVEDKEQYDMFGLGIVAMDALLASLEAEPVEWRVAFRLDEQSGSDFEKTFEDQAKMNEIISLHERAGFSASITHLFTAPPAPVENTGLQRKAAVHDALCEKYNVESLADFVDWQRNHIAELEAEPPAPVGPAETAVMPDYPGYALTQRECFQAGEERAAQKAWVACSERMPTPNQYVLVCNGVWVGMGMHNNSEHLEDDERWQDERHEFIDLLHHPVTHWMPLPSPPQQE